MVRVPLFEDGSTQGSVTHTSLRMRRQCSQACDSGAQERCWEGATQPEGLSGELQQGAPPAASLASCFGFGCCPTQLSVCALSASPVLLCTGAAFLLRVGRQELPARRQVGMSPMSDPQAPALPGGLQQQYVLYGPPFEWNRVAGEAAGFTST